MRDTGVTRLGADASEPESRTMSTLLKSMTSPLTALRSALSASIGQRRLWVPSSYSAVATPDQRGNTEEVMRVADRAQFRGTIRFFRPERAAGLAVVDVPSDVTAALGGLKQMRVRGVLNGLEFTSTMPAGGGILALSVSRKLLDAAGLSVGDEAEIEIERVDAGA